MMLRSMPLETECVYIHCIWYFRSMCCYSFVKSAWLVKIVICYRIQEVFSV